MTGPYKVRITAGGKTRWIASDMQEAFTDVEANAAVFSDTLSTFNKYVLGEVEYAEFHNSKTYNDLGLEKIEFIF